LAHRGADLSGARVQLPTGGGDLAHEIGGLEKTLDHSGYDLAGVFGAVDRLCGEQLDLSRGGLAAFC
jgi:hypothetical protein